MNSRKVFIMITLAYNADKLNFISRVHTVRTAVNVLLEVVLRELRVFHQKPVCDSQLGCF